MLGTDPVPQEHLEVALLIRRQRAVAVAALSAVAVLALGACDSAPEEARRGRASTGGR